MNVDAGTKNNKQTNKKSKQEIVSTSSDTQIHLTLFDTKQTKQTPHYLNDPSIPILPSRFFRVSFFLFFIYLFIDLVRYRKGRM